LVLGILFVIGCGVMVYLHVSGKLEGMGPGFKAQAEKMGFGMCGNRMKFACY
jgi:hypothetical protein